MGEIFGDEGRGTGEGEVTTSGYHVQREARFSEEDSVRVQYLDEQYLA